MPDYKQGKIYALRSYKTTMIYIGSTTQTLSQRLGGHMRCYKCWLNNTGKYRLSFEIIKQGDCYIELIEYADCKTRAELLKKEGEFIRKMKCVNTQIPGRDLKQYYIDNKKELSNKGKKYYEKNKERISQRHKEYRERNKNKEKKRHVLYREKNRDKISIKRREAYQKNKEKLKQQNKEYREKNKELISQRQKEHYEKNKERISQRRKELYHEKKLKKEWKKRFNEVLKNIK